MSHVRLQFWSVLLIAFLATADAAWAQSGRYTRTAVGRGRAVDLLPILSDGKWGFIDAQGRVVIEPRFGTRGQFNDGLAVVTLDGVHGYVDLRGDFTPMPDYAELFPFSDSMGRVAVLMNSSGGGDARKTMRFTFLNTTLRPSTKSYFDLAGDYREGLCRAVPYGGAQSAKEPLWGFIDRRGRFSIPPQWAEVGDVSESRARVRIDGKWGYIDGEGSLVISPRYDGAGDFHEGLAAVRIDGKLGYIDPRGATAVSPRFHYAGDFSAGLALVTDRFGQAFYFIDRSGKRAFSGDFEAAGAFSDGLARVYREGKWGYIDTSGKPQIPPQFDDAHDFRGGVGLVAVDNAWGYVNTKGEFIWKSR